MYTAHHALLQLAIQLAISNCMYHTFGAICIKHKKVGRYMPTSIVAVQEQKVSDIVLSVKKAKSVRIVLTSTLTNVAIHLVVNDGPACTNGPKHS